MDLKEKGYLREWRQESCLSVGTWSHIEIAAGTSQVFGIGVSVPKGSVLSLLLLLLFSIVMDETTRGQKAFPWT